MEFPIQYPSLLPCRSQSERFPCAHPWRALSLTLCLVLLFSTLQASVAQAALPVKAALMMNLSTGRILYQRNADMKIPPASLTKIMTSFLVYDAINAGRLSMNTPVRITSQMASVGGSSMHLRQSETATIEQLLHGAIICSGNDAATALALRTFGSTQRFVRNMNAKAARLGMKNTLFKNPTGLPAAGQVTTARDMARLARAYLTSHPGAMRIHGKSFFHFKGRELKTTNPFLNTHGVNGLKTGFTLSSGYNIILTTGRGKNKLLIVVLGANSKSRREAAASSLLTAGLRFPSSPSKVQQLVDAGQKNQLATGKKSANDKQAATGEKVTQKKSPQKAQASQKTQTAQKTQVARQNQNARKTQPAQKKQKSQETQKAQKEQKTRKDLRSQKTKTASHS